MAAAARRGRRRAGDSQTLAGGRRPSRLECAEFAAGRFHAGGFSDEPLSSPVARYWKAMTCGGSTGRPKVILDHQPAVVDTAATPTLGITPGFRCSIPARSITTRRSSCRTRRLFTVDGSPASSKFDAEETPAPDRGRTGAMGQFRADHDASDLGAAGRSAQRLRLVEPAGRVSHGSADAAMAEGKMDRVAGAGA